MLLVDYNDLLVYGESAQCAYTSEQAITKAHHIINYWNWID